MKYLCLIYYDEKTLDTMSARDYAAMAGECATFNDGLRANGQFIAAEALQPTSAAATLRIRNGRVTALDGPFAETKEQLGGFFLIDAKDFNEAIRLAAKIPPARLGCVEVRPVRDVYAAL